MSCLVSSEGGDEDVTFLYRVTAGNCPKSYGFNVARKAGLPEAVVREAQAAAARLERKLSRQKQLHLLMKQLSLDAQPLDGTRVLLKQIQQLATAPDLDSSVKTA